MSAPFIPQGDEPPPPPYTPPTSQNPATSSAVSSQPQELCAQADRKSVPMGQPATRGEPLNISQIKSFAQSRPFTRAHTLHEAGIQLEPISYTFPISPATQAHDLPYPEPRETFFNRDITFADWETFTRSLIIFTNPLQDPRYPAFVNLENLSTQVHPIVVEWNTHFFAPRNTTMKAAVSPGSPQPFPHQQQQQPYHQPTPQQPYAQPQIAGTYPPPAARSSSGLDNLVSDTERATKDLTKSLEGVAKGVEARLRGLIGKRR